MPSSASLALIADVHGNSWALDVVLADIARRGITRIINLGDSLDGPLDPAGAAAHLLAARERFVVNLRGNGERLLLANLASGQPRPLYRQLDAATVGWLGTLPATDQYEGVSCCHGRPEDDQTYLLEEVSPDGCVHPVSIPVLMARWGRIPGDVIACAHSHLPRVVPLPGDRLIVNPGSVGLPAYTDDLPYPHAMESGDPQARYAILHGAAFQREVEPVSLNYSWQEAAAAARRNGREDWARWIKSGRAEAAAI